jgi:hypothetical protein
MMFGMEVHPIRRDKQALNWICMCGSGKAPRVIRVRGGTSMFANITQARNGWIPAGLSNEPDGYKSKRLACCGRWKSAASVRSTA